jgi:hypothetical protein
VTTRLPLGFDSFDQFNLFRRELVLAVAAEGARAEAWIIGTAATGFSMNLAKPQGHAFSKTSDIDVVLRSLELMQKMKEAGGQADTSWNFQGKHLWLRNDGPNGFLTACTHVAAFATKWSRLLPLPVDVRLFIGVRGLMTHVDEFLELQDPIELWPQSIYDSEGGSS